MGQESEIAKTSASADTTVYEPLVPNPVKLKSVSPEPESKPESSAWWRLPAATLAVIVIWARYNVGMLNPGNGYVLANRVNAASRTVKPSGTIPMTLVSVGQWGEAERNGSRPLRKASWETDIRNVNERRKRLRLPGTVYSDEDCIALMHATGWHALAHAFLKETHGPYKSDICRSLVLHTHGGIYTDNDLGVLDFHPASLFAATAADFVSCAEFQGGGVWNAFMASTPHHPVLATQLQLMVDYYAHPGNLHAELGKRHDQRVMGTATLRRAVDAHLGTSAIYLLTETHLPSWRGLPTWRQAVAARLNSGFGIVALDPGAFEMDFEVARAYSAPIFISKTPDGAGRQTVEEMVYRELLRWLGVAMLVAAYVCRRMHRALDRPKRGG